MSMVSNLNIKIQSGTTNTLYASWYFGWSNLNYYKVEWYYSTGDGVWFKGSSSQVEEMNDLYNIPSNAISVRVTVTPISTMYDNNGNQQHYWTGVPTSSDYTVSSGVPIQPTSPTVSLDQYKLTATIDNITDINSDEIEFQVLKDISTYTSGVSQVVTQRATFSCTLVAGYTYRVRCRAINIVNGVRIFGEWSLYSNDITVIPSEISHLLAVVDSKNTVRLSWVGSPTATSYDIQYAINKLYFNSSSEVKTTTVTSTSAYINGLEAGREWFFRVRAVNQQGASGWSTIVSKIIGTTPGAPTTWALTTTAIVGDDVILYWVHNSEDGATMTKAQIRVIIDGLTYIYDYDNTDPSSESGSIFSYNLDLSNYRSGAEILWSIRTKGIEDEYGGWSIQRTINLYAPPTLQLNINKSEVDWTLDSFPLIIEATAGPSNQIPVSYYISITNNSTYEIEDLVGTNIVVNAGTEIYSKAFNVSDNPLRVLLSAEDVTFKNNQEYTITVTVAMDSGLTASTWDTFIIDWTDASYFPNAVVYIDRQTLSAYISPFCIDDSENIIDGLTLSVYRREHDGSFTQIATGLDNSRSITVTDPHPPLDYARYRIIAKSISTGKIGYSDIPGYPVKEPSIVIQWDEEWVELSHGDGPVKDVLMSGSMVRLPYNIDITENHDMDVSLIGYIGRKHPVSYYGTQTGESSNLSTEIPKTDKETLYALRRLSTWGGNVYVREPSGTGYWAQVSVSISTTHRDLVTKVSFDIKRVEGGI